jgi:cytochrome P450
LLIGLRVHGAAPGLLERVVPAFSPKSESSNENFDLMGYSLPRGTIVATEAWSMHHDPSIFPSPSTFLPDRWLETPGSADNTKQLTMMQQHFMPFGTGSRMCGGHILAMIMLRVVIAAGARNFDVVTPAETIDRSMEDEDSLFCLIYFSALTYFGYTRIEHGQQTDNELK